MALQIRRGVNSLRTTINPAEGELLYTTDTKKVYVGDGSTAGGVPVTSLVTDTSPTLGGNLSVNGFSITSTSNGNISIDPDGTGKILLKGVVSNTSGNLNIAPANGLTVIGDAPGGLDGNLYIVRGTYSSNPVNGLVFAQHHNTQEAVNFNFLRSRGSPLVQTKVLSGDRLANIVFGAWNGTTVLGGGAIQSTATADTNTNFVQANLRFLTANGAFPAINAEITGDGIFRIRQLGALATNKNITIPTDTTLTVGDVRLSQNGLSTITSNANLTLTSSGTGRIVMAGSVYVTGSSLQLTGISTATRNAMSVANGMLIYNSDLGKFQGYENGSWVNLV